MTDVVLSSDDLTVLGGPSRLNVAIDIGTTGPRGSRIFVGSGKPSFVDIGQSPLIFDTYINLLASDDEYLNFYQYQLIDGVNTWVNLLNLRPESTSSKVMAEFLDGESVFYIPVTNLVPPEIVESVTSDSFNVQATIKNGVSPISFSITIGEPEIEADIYSLPITINAVEYVDLDDSGPLTEYGWQAAAGEKEVDIFITLVNTTINGLES
jgi:hypothetical protein